MAEHTPGPWTTEIEAHKGPDDWYAAAIGVGSPWSGTYRTLARIHQGDPSWSEEAQARAEADANLIAAAPEMYALLENLHADLARYAKVTEEVWSSGSIAFDSMASDVSRVLAKARGEASRG